MSRYVILGAGAVGGVIGGRLHQAGHDVTLIARGAHGEAIAAGGLRLRDPDSDVVLPITRAADPAGADWRPGDVVVLATKSQQATAALDALAAAAPPDVTVVCATNGLEAERLALRRFASVVAMTVMLPAEHLVPGEVRAYCAPVTGILDVGRYPSGLDATVTSIAADLAGAGFLSEAVAEPMRAKRRKLLMNLANVLEAASGPAARGSDLWAAAVTEAEACFAAAGLEVQGVEEEAERRGDRLRIRPIAGERRDGGSTWQSLARGTGDTEADYLNGEVVLLGRLHGVPTPVNERLQHLARDLATSGAAPGSVALDDLSR